MTEKVKTEKKTQHRHTLTLNVSKKKYEIKTIISEQNSKHKKKIVKKKKLVKSEISETEP